MATVPHLSPQNPTLPTQGYGTAEKKPCSAVGLWRLHSNVSRGARRSWKVGFESSAAILCLHTGVEFARVSGKSTSRFRLELAPARNYE